MFQRSLIFFTKPKNHSILEPCVCVLGGCMNLIVSGAGGFKWIYKSSSVQIYNVSDIVSCRPWTTMWQTPCFQCHSNYVGQKMGEYGNVWTQFTCVETWNQVLMVKCIYDLVKLVEFIIWDICSDECWCVLSHGMTWSYRMQNNPNTNSLDGHRQVSNSITICFFDKTVYITWQRLWMNLLQTRIAYILLSHPL